MTPVAFAGCLGWLHAAAGGRGVVLCPPWGFEALCVHRAFRDLARDLADAGLPCLRLDLPGTGDSLDPAGPSSAVETWVEAVLAAVRLLRARTAAEEVALVGLRLGALLAAEAGARLGGVARLALLAPPASGRACVRELRAWARLAAGGPADHGSAADEGGVVAGGFRLDAAALEALAALDPLRRPDPPARRILALERPEAPRLEGTWQAWRAAGAAVEARPLVGYAELMRDPLLASPPGPVLATLVGHLAEGLPRPARRLPAAAPPAPPARLLGPGFVEETLRLGPGGRLVATLTGPPAAAASTERPALLILNTGATHRVGPGRSAVELARALARDGISSLRLDLGGIGDSDLPEGERSGEIYRRGALAEVGAAVDLLVARGARGVVALGVCSGAFMAFHAALDDPRIVGLVLVDLPRFAWRPFSPLVFVRTRELVGLLGRTATWQRALRGEGDLVPALRVLSERLAARLVASLPAPARRLAAALGRPQRRLRALTRRGVRLLVLYAADDPGLALFDRAVDRRGARLVEGGLEVRVIEGAGHTFSDPASRALLVDLARAHLARHWPPRGAPPGRSLRARPMPGGQVRNVAAGAGP